MELSRKTTYLNNCISSSNDALNSWSLTAKISDRDPENVTLQSMILYLSDSKNKYNSKDFEIVLDESYCFPPLSGNMII